MADMGTKNNAKGADFGRGTKQIKGEDYTEILKGNAPDIKPGGGDGKVDITDKTS